MGRFLGGFLIVFSGLGAGEALAQVRLIDHDNPPEGYVSRAVSEGTILQPQIEIKIKASQQEQRVIQGTQSCTWKFHSKPKEHIVAPRTRNLVVGRPKLTNGSVWEWTSRITVYEVEIPFKGDPDIAGLNCRLNANLLRKNFGEDGKPSDLPPEDIYPSLDDVNAILGGTALAYRDPKRKWGTLKGEVAPAESGPVVSPSAE